jgi:hypothetical protein
MEDLNVTILEGDQNQEDKVKIELEEVVKKSKTDKVIETHKCDECEKVFPKFMAKSLHMRKAHNIKTLQYTPAPGNKKVGRPAYKFPCDLCNEKRKTESDLRNHMTLKHGPAKRDILDIKQESVKRTASLKISPPNKKTKAGTK